MSIFEDVVLLLGRRQAIDELAREVGVSATEPARVGVVLSLPVVIAHLARWVEPPDTDSLSDRRPGRSRARADWLLDRLESVAPTAAADYPSLAADVELRQLGAEVLDLVLGQPWDDITEKIARRTDTSLSAADGLLRMTSAAVLANLAARHRSSIGGEAMARELADERQELLASGWSPWMSETDRSPARPVDGRAHHRPAAYPPPVARHPVPDRGGVSTTARSRSLVPGRDDRDGDRRSGALDPAPSVRAPRRPPSDLTDGVESGSGRIESEPSSARPDGEDRPSPPSRGPRARRDRRSGRRIEPAPVLVFGGLAIAVALAGFALVSLVTESDGDGTDLVTGSEAVEVAATPPQSGAGDPEPEVVPEPTATPDGGESAAVTAPAGQVITVPLADPLGRTEGTGTAELTIDPGTGEICYAFEVDGVASPYDGHIHVGPVGVKGGIVVDFGELEGNPSGCLDNAPASTAAILADLAGHYVEFHDADDVTTVRAQLAEPAPGAPPTGSVEDESATGGAVVRIEVGRLVLSGEVPDQVTIDKLVETFADIDLGSTQLVNELTIVPGSPRPSGNILVDDAIFFEFDSDRLVDPGSTVLNDLATIFKARPAWTMTVVGHTDSSGTDVYNLELSLRRAAAVRDALIAAGVAEGALTIVGAGSTEPIAPNDTPEGRAQNRRIEIEVTPG